MRAVHRHAIFGSYFDSRIRPIRRKPRNDAEIPLVTSCVRNVVKSKLIAGPMLGGVLFLKNDAALQPVNIGPHGKRKRLVCVEISGLAQVDFRFATEFRGFARRTIFIENFASHKLSMVF